MLTSRKRSYHKMNVYKMYNTSFIISVERIYLEYIRNVFFNLFRIKSNLKNVNKTYPIERHGFNFFKENTQRFYGQCSFYPYKFAL